MLEKAGPLVSLRDFLVANNGTVQLLHALKGYEAVLQDPRAQEGLAFGSGSPRN